MTVQEYHELPYLSSSRLKEFLEDRYKFKKYHVDGFPQPKKKHTGSTLQGDLVDFFLLRDIESGGSEIFDDVYALYVGNKTPPQFIDFCDFMFNKAEDFTDDLGKVNVPFEEILSTCFKEFSTNEEGERVKFKAKRYDNFDNFIIDFDKKAKDYYKFLLDNSDRSIVTLKDIDNAKKVVKKATESWVTRRIFDLRSNSKFEVLKQFPIIFDFLGERIKVLLDLVIIDLTKKTIHPFDLKTLFRQAEFKNNYFRFKYWISTGLYSTAIKLWAESNGYENFNVKPLGFIRVSTNFMEAPLITLTSDEQYVKCMEGFVSEGVSYKGVRQLIEEIKYHKEKGFWDMEAEHHKNKGVTKIDFI